jgi:hypothetical protein
MLEEMKRIGAADNKTPHMRNIEQSGLLAGRQMFLYNTGFILHRHFPTTEFHHFSAQFDMLFMKYGFEQLFHWFCPFFTVYGLIKYSQEADGRQVKTPLQTVDFIFGRAEHRKPGPENQVFDFD